MPHRTPHRTVNDRADRLLTFGLTALFVAAVLLVLLAGCTTLGTN